MEAEQTNAVEKYQHCNWFSWKASNKDLTSCRYILNRVKENYDFRSKI